MNKELAILIVNALYTDLFIVDELNEESRNEAVELVEEILNDYNRLEL